MEALACCSLALRSSGYAAVGAPRATTARRRPSFCGPRRARGSITATTCSSHPPARLTSSRARRCTRPMHRRRSASTWYTHRECPVWSAWTIATLPSGKSRALNQCGMGGWHQKPCRNVRRGTFFLQSVYNGAWALLCCFTYSDKLYTRVADHFLAFENIFRM